MHVQSVPNHWEGLNGCLAGHSRKECRYCDAVSHRTVDSMWPINIKGDVISEGQGDSKEIGPFYNHLKSRLPFIKLKIICAIRCSSLTQHFKKRESTLFCC